MTETIKESFEWMSPEFKVVDDAGKNTIRIKGVAMKGDVISKNKRKYVDEELKKAARTWIGKPVTINHNPQQIVGDIKWMEYSDQSNALEYLADIKKQPYVDMIRSKSTAIRGVSIEANYLHNRCPKCDKKFYTEEDFHKHMHGEHFIKTNPTTEPHGILGQALSLVLSPEEPGYSGSSIELLEMYRKPVLRLLETVASTQMEKENYMTKLRGKAALTSIRRIAVPTASKLKEQEESPTPPCPEGYHEEEGACVKNVVPATEQDESPTPPCPEGWHEEDGVCVRDLTEQEEHECPEGEHWSEEEGKCVQNEAAEQEEHECAEGEHWDSEQGKCVKDEPAATEQVEDGATAPAEGTVPTLEPKCPEGFHREGEECVPDTPPAAEPQLPVTPVTPSTAEIKLPKMLSLGEPFADYDSWEDCISKNQEKDDPEAYCASVKQEVEGETVKENVYDAQKAIVETVKNIRKTQAKRNRIISENFNKLNQAAANLAANVSNAREEAKRIFTELGKMRSDLKTTQKYNAEKLSQLATGQMHTIKEVNAALKKMPRDDVSWKTQIATVKAEYKKAVETVKKDFETVLAVADKNIEETRKTLEEQLKTLEEEKGKLETQLKTKEEKEVKETQGLTMRIDNLEAKLLKPEFKGRAGVKENTTVVEHPEDPLKKRR